MAHPTRLFQNPDEIWQLFEKYRKSVKDNPRKKHTFVGKDGNSEYELLEVPLTIEGFKCYCYDNVGCIGQYLVNQDGLYDHFITICSRVKEAIRRDQIEGGMVGQYNSSITQRLNGLVDKKETEIKGGLSIPNLPDIGNRK